MVIMGSGSSTNEWKQSGDPKFQNYVLELLKKSLPADDRDDGKDSNQTDSEAGDSEENSSTTTDTMIKAWHEIYNIEMEKKFYLLWENNEDLIKAMIVRVKITKSKDEKTIGLKLFYGITKRLEESLNIVKNTAIINLICKVLSDGERIKRGESLGEAQIVRRATEIKKKLSGTNLEHRNTALGILVNLTRNVSVNRGQLDGARLIYEQYKVSLLPLLTEVLVSDKDDDSRQMSLEVVCSFATIPKIYTGTYVHIIDDLRKEAGLVSSIQRLKKSSPILSKKAEEVLGCIVEKEVEQQKQQKG